MPYDKPSAACGEPNAATALTGRGRAGPARHRPGGQARLLGLAIGALALLVACSSSTSSASSGGTTPAQTSEPAVSSPAASSPPSVSGSITAGPPSSSQMAAFTAAAEGQCGFTSSADTLTNAKVTSNGWGSATVTARNPQDQGNATLIFRLNTGWTYDTCGSEFSGSNIPQDVLTALGL